jgi:hypothetical protein
MNVVLASIMRNGSGYLDRYFSQAAALREVLANQGHTLLMRVAEGDSSDDTWARLIEAVRDTPGMAVYKLDHGGPEFGSIDDATRWRNIARTWNSLFERIKEDDFDALIYVEADLLWEPLTMVRLLDRLDERLRPVDVVSPMSMHVAGFFYDTWGYRAGGQRFGPNPPYHPQLAGRAAENLLRLDSAGSCKVMRDEVARRCRFSEADAMLGHDIKAKGYFFYLDHSLAVYHP